jgi:hypothetical protein
MGLRERLRGITRRRLMRLRGRVDKRIDRLEQKRQRLDARLEKRALEPKEEGPAEEPPPTESEQE